MKILQPFCTIFFLTLLFLASPAVNGQGDSAVKISPDSTAQSYKPEILTTGFIDVVNNGQVNASARLVRVFIGEPGKFAVPLSFFSGVSANNFASQQSPGSARSNDHLVNNFINPLSGLINVSVDNIAYFSKANRRTRLGLLYHFGEKVLTGFKTGDITDPQTGTPVNFLNSFAAAGLYFQTGAWEKNNARNLGVFWLSYRYIFCYSKPSQLQEFLPQVQTNGVYHGYCIGGGVEINELINVKVLYYKYLKKPEIEYGQAIYQFSFNYALKK